MANANDVITKLEADLAEIDAYMKDNNIGSQGDAWAMSKRAERKELVRQLRELGATPELPTELQADAEKVAQPRPDVRSLLFSGPPPVPTDQPASWAK